MYCIGDTVVHPGHGACIVGDIEKRIRNGVSKCFYTLHPTTEQHMTILVPVDNAMNLGLRDVIAAEDANAIIDYTNQVEENWISDTNQRKMKYQKDIKGGDLKDLSQMCKTLMCREVRGTLCSTDKELLLQAQKKLLSEISVALGVTYDDSLERFVSKAVNLWVIQPA